MLNVGDLVRYTSKMGQQMAIIIERDIKSDEGNWWWRVYVPSADRRRIVGEWELEEFDGEV